ncbi:MAG: MFS transporter [Anaerolineaceae bacterium]|nr:MFS transporter [Anaerolineaceae bacterium]
MKKKQLFALLMCSIVLGSGNGLFPLLPVYAEQLGSQPAAVGYYLSFCYIGLTAGTSVGGWLSDKFQRRKILLLIGGGVNVPVIWLLGRATNIWNLAALTAGCYFLGSMLITLISILTGLFAEPEERGKIFGLLTLTGPLMMLVAGATFGSIVDRWGFQTMFTGLALFASLFLLFALLVEDKTMVLTQTNANSPARDKVGLGRGFYLLVLACILSSCTYFVGRLGISLAMNKLSYTLTSISITGAIGGGVALPLLPTLGWLSDRLGRKRLLVFCYLVGILGSFILAAALFQWHFWVVSGLLSIMLNGVTAVGSALVTDLVPRSALGRGMSLFNASTWIGGIIGLGGTGLAVQGFGMAPTFIAAAFLPVVAILLLIRVQRVEKGMFGAAAGN